MMINPLSRIGLQQRQNFPPRVLTQQHSQYYDSNSRLLIKLEETYMILLYVFISISHILFLYTVGCENGWSWISTSKKICQIKKAAFLCNGKLPFKWSIKAVEYDENVKKSQKSHDERFISKQKVLMACNRKIHLQVPFSLIRSNAWSGWANQLFRANLYKWSFSKITVVLTEIINKKWI